MEIKKGDEFKCIKDVVMDSGEIAYRAGKVYESEYDGCITDEQGNVNMIWIDSYYYGEYFEPYKTEESKESKEFYYIRGDKKRGAEVIKMLEEKGGKLENCRCGDCEEAYYFIGDDGVIRSMFVSYIESLLKAHGTELKLPTELQDKQLVWCGYDPKSPWTYRVACFYDAVNNCTFKKEGGRGGTIFRSYEPYEGEYPDWAKEALKLLED